MVKVTLVRDSKEGDWECLYIDGEELDQTHRVDLAYWLDKYGVIEYRRLNMDAWQMGRFPEHLEDVPTEVLPDDA